MWYNLQKYGNYKLRNNSARVAIQRADFQTATIKISRRGPSQFQRTTVTRP